MTTTLPFGKITFSHLLITFGMKRAMKSPRSPSHSTPTPAASHHKGFSPSSQLFLCLRHLRLPKKKQKVIPGPLLSVSLSQSTTLSFLLPRCLQKPAAVRQLAGKRILWQGCVWQTGQNLQWAHHHSLGSCGRPPAAATSSQRDLPQLTLQQAHHPSWCCHHG